MDGQAPRIQGNHDKLACDWVASIFPIDKDEETAKYAKRISELIACHMGRWGTNPHFLSVSSEDLVHMADYIAVQDFAHYNV